MDRSWWSTEIPYTNRKHWSRGKYALDAQAETRYITHMATNPNPKPRRKGKIAGDKSDIVTELPAACSNEALAVEFMERMRWGDCPCCPRCGDTNVRQMLDADGNRNKRFLWKCLGCKRQYTVRINSVYEDSRIPMRHWVFAFWSACTHKKGVSALQIKRQTGLNYRSALFLMNRIRHAMTPTNPPKMDGTLEADEVYLGGKAGNKINRKRPPEKTACLAIVNRTGEIRTQAVPVVTAKNIMEFVHKNIQYGSLVITDGHMSYRHILPHLYQHETVDHHKHEYVRKSDHNIHTNTVEGFFNLLRKRLDGTHHSVTPEHLFRYCNEAAFVYSTRKVDDGERTVLAIRGANNKRLTYKETVCA